MLFGIKEKQLSCENAICIVFITGYGNEHLMKPFNNSFV